MNLTGMTFRAVANSSTGTLNTETTMRFRSDDGVVLGDYSGGTILAGHVLASHISDTELEMLYQGATVDGKIQAGRAKATFNRTPSGDTQMHLDWQWLTDDRTSGESEWILIDTE